MAYPVFVFLIERTQSLISHSSWWLKWLELTAKICYQACRQICR